MTRAKPKVHGWSVGHLVVGGGYGFSRYVVRCDCGWESDQYEKETDAAKAASRHVGITQVDPEPPAPRVRGPRQAERLFE